MTAWLMRLSDGDWRLPAGGELLGVDEHRRFVAGHPQLVAEPADARGNGASEREVDEIARKVGAGRDRQRNAAGEARVDLEDDRLAVDDAALDVDGAGKRQRLRTDSPSSISVRSCTVRPRSMTPARTTTRSRGTMESGRAGSRRARRW